MTIIYNMMQMFLMHSSFSLFFFFFILDLGGEIFEIYMSNNKFQIFTCQ